MTVERAVKNNCLWPCRTAKIENFVAARVKLARKIRILTLTVTNLNFPRFLVSAWFIFKANFQSNQVAIPLFIGIIPGFQGTIPGFQVAMPGFQVASPVL